MRFAQFHFIIVVVFLFSVRLHEASLVVELHWHHPTVMLPQEKLQLKTLSSDGYPIRIYTDLKVADLGQFPAAHFAKIRPLLLTENIQGIIWKSGRNRLGRISALESQLPPTVLWIWWQGSAVFKTTVTQKVWISARLWPRLRVRINPDGKGGIPYPGHELRVRSRRHHHRHSAP